MAIGRRTVLGAAFAVPALLGSSLMSTNVLGQAQGKVLVAYLTRSGNTRVIAKQISRSLKADLFEITPATPYPEDYFAHVKQAEQERVTNFEPALAALVTAMASYDTVFLGFPIWGETAPSVIRSFLSKHDLSGKTLVPFITHGGYGLGSSLDVIAAHAPKAKIAEGLTMQADQERRTVENVIGWLGDTHAA